MESRRITCLPASVAGVPTLFKLTWHRHLRYVPGARSDEEFMPAFKKALAADRSALIEVQTDYEYVTPTATLSDLAGKKLAGD